MNGPEAPEKRLESWKEIGAYLQRNAVTARRWEKEEGLPVHRHSHKSRSSVYAYASELDAWRLTRKLAVEPRPAMRWWRRLAFAVTTLLFLLMAGSEIRPTVAAAQSPKQLLRQIWSGQALDGYAAPSSDDRYIAFTDWSSGNLAVRDLRAGKNRMLTAGGYRDGHPEHAVVSPDRREIAYAWMNYQTSLTELRVIPAAGGDPKTVYRNDDTAYLWPAGWTPDGSRVLATRVNKDRTSEIAMISVHDGSARVVKSLGWGDPGRISLSPDGKYAAFSAPPSESVTAHDIFVLPVDGGREVNITGSPAIDWSPMWSPDGSRVLFLSDRTGSVSLWTVPVAAGKASGPAVIAKQDIGFIDPLGITRSGTYYFNAGSLGRRNVYMADLDSGMKAAKPAISAGHYINANGGGSFSPDGKYLAYYAFRAPNTAIPGTTLLVIRTLDTGAEREVPMPGLRLPVFAPPPRWFPGGSSVLVAASGSKSHAAVLSRVDVTTGQSEVLLETRQTVPGQTYADLALGGKAIFYLDRETGASQLMRCDLESRRASEVLRVPKGQNITSIAASPDGRQLAYGLYDSAKKSTALEVMPASGGAAREIYVGADWHKGANFSLAWSHDQRYLIFARPDGSSTNSYSPQNLWRVALSGGEPEKMGISAESIFYPQMHPDGRRIAFTGRENNAQEVWALENFLPKTPAAK